MTFNRILLLIVVSLSVTSVVLGADIATAKPLSSTPDITQPYASQAKRLTVALVSDIKPYQFYQQQQAQGYIADWWRLWGQANGYEIVFKMTTGQDSIDLVVHRQADLHGGIENTPSLATRFYFSKPIIPIQSQLFLTRDVISTKRIESLYPYVIGVIRGSSIIDMLTTQYPKFKVMIYSSRVELLAAVKQGQVKVIAAISASIFSANNFSTLFPQTKRISLFSHSIRIGVLKSNQNLINLVERGRNNISPAMLRQLSRKWFSTKRNNATLMLSTSLHYAPLAAISPEGKPFGYLIELWELWSEKNNTSIDFMPSYRTDILDNVRSGAADLTLSYPEHQKTADLIKGRKMATIDVGVFYYTDKFKLLSLKELAGRRIGYDAAVMGNETLSKLRLMLPDSQLMPLNSVYELINAVRGGDVVAIMMTTHFGQATLNYLNLAHQFKQVSNFNYGLDIFIWANKKTAPLLPEIDRGFDAISQAELDQLATKWFRDSAVTPKRALGEISSQEKKWIRKHSDIRFGYVKSRVPFEYIDQQNQMDGINRTTLDLIAAKTRLNFTFHSYSSVAQLLKAVKTSEVDVISSVYEYSTNWSDFKLTQPYWDSSLAVISQEGHKFDQLSQLQGKIIAVNTNSSYRQYLLKMLADVILIDVDSMASGVEAVASGKVDMYIGNVLIAVHEIRDKSYDDFSLSIIDSAPRANPRFVVRADWLVLVSILDKAVSKISASERLTLLEQWQNYSLKGEAKYQDLLRLIVPMSVLALLVFYCFIYWNSRLREEIKLRLALQKKLEHQARYDDLTGIPNRAWLKENIQIMLKEHRLTEERLLCLFIDLDGFKSINDSYGHDVGDLLLVQFCRRLTHHLRHGDFVARFGGDEFVVLASLKDPERGSEAITKMVHQIYQNPIMIDHLEIKISCSIGAAIFPLDGTTFEQLIKKADLRMYHQKNTKDFDNVTKVRFRVDE